MTPKIDVFYSAQSFSEDDVRGKTVVVIDVLRASSTIVTALAHGAKGIIPVPSMGDASQMAAKLDSSSFLLCGEKDGITIEGFDLGNSPLDYTEEVVADKTLILTTTNGTRAISRSSLAKEILIASFLNISKVVDYLQSIENDILIVCSGWKGRLSIEDVLCAGNIVAKLQKDPLPLDYPDGAKVALSLYLNFKDDLANAVAHSNHANRLKGIVESDDVEYCSQIDIFDILPVINDGIILNAET